MCKGVFKSVLNTEVSSFWRFGIRVFYHLVLFPASSFHLIASSK